MVIAHVTQTGNISIPKLWREELGIEPDSEVFMEKTNTGITIEPLKPKSLIVAFRAIDKEIRTKDISFTREEAIAHDFFD